MSSWIPVSERLPRDDETLDGRVPIVDGDGYLGYAVLINNSNQKPWLMSEFDAKFWLPVPQLEKS